MPDPTGFSPSARDRRYGEPRRLAPAWGLADPAPPTSRASIAAVAALLAGHGLTRIYTAACQPIAVICVSTGLTAWTNGRQLWIIRDGQRETWPATRTQAAAARLAELAQLVVLSGHDPG